MSSPHVVEIDHRLRQRADEFAALGEPVRLAIAESLLLTDLTPQDIVEEMGIRSNLLAHHLKVLEAAGLVTRSRSEGDGRRRYLHLRTDRPVPGLKVPPAKATKVLFVCTGHAARSRLAERIWSGISDIPTSSAGPAARRWGSHAASSVARQRGLSPLDGPPVHFSAVADSADMVVTLCDLAREDHAISDDVGTTTMHWSLPTPVSDTVAEYRDLADQITARALVLARALDDTRD